ncbi:MAG: metallophosphoesterase family protein [Chloroflexi bacterium]|nr:metallophosphoesterase family protein [Chloroflexota bacterium]
MPTTLGLIADIHADDAALTRALDLLHDKGVDTILCAGDLVEKGPDGDAVVRQIGELAIPCVRGNHDEAAAGNQLWMRQNADLSLPQVQARLLSEETLVTLQGLPFSLRYTYEGLRVLVVHGTPTSNSQYLFPEIAPVLYQHAAAEADADVVICGHTHMPARTHIGGVWFFNPGSVCQSGFMDSHTCARLRLPDMAFQVFSLATGEKVPTPVFRG